MRTVTMFFVGWSTVLLAPWVVPQEFSSQIASLDVSSVIRLDHIKTSPGVVLFRWGGSSSGTEKSHLCCEKAVGKEWEEMSVELVPQDDGEVNLRFSSGNTASVFPGVLGVVWIDDVRAGRRLARVRPRS